MAEKPPSFSRRDALVGAGAALGMVAMPNRLLGTAVAGTTKTPPKIGTWATDSVGLPTFNFTADLPILTATPKGASYPLEKDPFFLLGNYGLTLFTYASGLFLIVSGERGWVRINGAMPGTESNGASLTVRRNGTSKVYKLLGRDGLCSSSRKSTREFGCGFARYRMTPEKDLEVSRTISIAPSTASEIGHPAFVTVIRVTNRGKAPVDIEYVDTVVSQPVLALNRAPLNGSAPVRFKNSATLLPANRGVVCDATASSDDPVVLTQPEAPNRYNLYPPSLALIAPRTSSELRFDQRAVSGDAIELNARVQATLAPGESKDIVLVTALKGRDTPLEALQQFADSLGASKSGEFFRAKWAQALSSLRTIPDPKFSRELAWDGHALLAMATYSGYHGETFIPQGMTYDYHMDLTAAPRDHLQHSMAAAYFAPELAKSTIRYTLCKMTYQGEIKYTDFGNGETSNSAWNTSDQQLYLFQALAEYLRITKDWSILEGETSYLPKEANFRGSTLEKLERAFVYLRDEVATGSHGLVRLMNSDWSDMVYVDTSVLRYLHTAESQMNSGMVMAVMPNLIEQLTNYGEQRGGDTAARVVRLTTGMQLYLDRISKSMMRDMDGRTFAKRVYLDANTAMGDEAMHLEPQSFLLQAPAFPTERKQILWREMQNRLLDGEVLGPRQREKPVVGGGMEPGVSENGGFWYALAGQAVIGVATIDRAAALVLLERMTFRNFSAHYRDYWVGHWTAPDTINSVFCGDLAGLPRPDNNGLWSIFAGYCAHAHAWPIYCYNRIREQS